MYYALYVHHDQQRDASVINDRILCVKTADMANFNEYVYNASVRALLIDGKVTDRAAAHY